MSISVEPILGMAWLPVTGELAIKATILLFFTAGAALLLRSSSAAVRHLVWCVGIVSLLAMPLLFTVLPPWELPLLRTVSHPSPPPAAIVEVGGTAVGAPWGGAVPAADAGPMQPVKAGGEWAPRATGLVMVSGMVLGLLWLGVGFWGTARIRRRAQVVRDPQWLSVAQEMSVRLSLRRPVLLLQSRDAVMPATCGLFFPCVVLPAAAEQWSGERRCAVLAHELAHVKRFDCLTQAIAHVACVLFWWHPAVWYAARRLRVERERACDDLVLLAGARASDYAMHLLEIARAYRPHRLAAPALVSMAKPSQLESRLLSVLDENRSRRMPSVRATAVAVLVSGGMVCSLTAMRPVERAITSEAVVAETAPHGTPLVQSLDGELGGSAPVPSEAETISESSGLTAAMEAELAVEPRAAIVDTVRPGTSTTPGGEDPSIDELIERRIHGVTDVFIRGMEALGFRGLTHRQLVAARIHGVTPEFIRQMREAGYATISLPELVSFRIHGVSPEYIRAMEARGHRGLSPEQLVQARIHRVTPDFVAEMEALGYAGLSLSRLVEMRIHGVTPELVRELRDIGVDDLAPEMLIRLRISGVDRELIRSRQRRQPAD